MNSRSCLVLSCWVLAVAPFRGVVGSDDGPGAWTGWLGPERDGWVQGFEPPAAWPEELTRVWQVEVGAGYGTPLVVGDRVFQHARQGEEEVLWCLKLGSGERVWRSSTQVPFKMGGGGERHGKGPKSNPAYADGRLFTMSITGVLSAWEASSGELLWRRDYGSRFEKAHPYWGTSTSPLIDGDRVFVHFGGDDEGVLVALDATTGDEVWSQGNTGAAYASPFVAEIDGVRQIVEWNHESLVGVDSATGRLLWSYPFPHVGTNQNMPSPMFHQGRVIVGGENRGIRCVAPKRGADGRWTAEELWYQKELALDMSTVILNDDRLYGFSHYDMGRLFCVDPYTGGIRWQGPERTGENVLFLAIPDHVVALINKGELRVLEASADEYRQAASYKVSRKQTWAPPVLLKDGVLIKDVDTLTRWRF